MYINGSCPQIVASYLCELRSQTLMTGARSAEPQKSARHVSGGCRCALVGVPWRGSVSARLAWGDLVKSVENAEHSETAGHTYEGTPTTA